MIKIILILLFPVFLFAQMNRLIFSSTDTLASATSQDTVQVRLGYDDGQGQWITLTQCLDDTVYITATDKANERVKIYDIINETWWSYFPVMEVRIVCAGTDTLSSGFMSIGFYERLTLFIKADTSGTNTDYGAGSRIVGY